jgi:hypothetical protein
VEKFEIVHTPPLHGFFPFFQQMLGVGVVVVVVDASGSP